MSSVLRQYWSGTWVPGRNVAL